MINRFNIRVYFILHHPDEEKVLLSDEIIQGKAYTKLPGGGLEFGEGPEDAAKREAREELGQDIQLMTQLYTTGFFQQSAFRSSDQVIGIYYLARLTETPRFRVSQTKHDFEQLIEAAQSFRWTELNLDILDELSFEIDRSALDHYLKMMKGRL